MWEGVVRVRQLRQFRCLSYPLLILVESSIQSTRTRFVGAKDLELTAVAHRV